jgi:hypothetical protein
MPKTKKLDLDCSPVGNHRAKCARELDFAIYEFLSSNSPYYMSVSSIVRHVIHIDCEYRSIEGSLKRLAEWKCIAKIPTQFVNNRAVSMYYCKESQAKSDLVAKIYANKMKKKRAAVPKNATGLPSRKVDLTLVKVAILVKLLERGHSVISLGIREYSEQLVRRALDEMVKDKIVEKCKKQIRTDWVGTSLYFTIQENRRDYACQMIENAVKPDSP